MLCPERRRYRVRRTAPTMSSARHVASRTGPTISTTQRVTVSEEGEPLTQLFHVSLPAVRAITVAMTKARRAPPESVEAPRKGQRGPPPAARRPSTDAPRTTRNNAAMTSIRRLLDIPRLCISHRVSMPLITPRRANRFDGSARHDRSSACECVHRVAGRCSSFRAGGTRLGVDVRCCPARGRSSRLALRGGVVVQPLLAVLARRRGHLPGWYPPGELLPRACES